MEKDIFRNGIVGSVDSSRFHGLRAVQRINCKFMTDDWSNVHVRGTRSLDYLFRGTNGVICWKASIKASDLIWTASLKSKLRVPGNTHIHPKDRLRQKTHSWPPCPPSLKKWSSGYRITFLAIYLGRWDTIVWSFWILHHLANHTIYPMDCAIQLLNI